MPSNRIPLAPVLEAAEYHEIDQWVAAHAACADVPRIAGFLEKRFAVTVTTDPDIVAGFAADSSHLPGHAAGLARPRNDRECAAVLRICHAAAIPVTISGGQSNLTGSATPEGGMVLSTTRMVSPAPRIDREARTVVAPVGILLEELRTVVRGQSDAALCFPVDPTSRADASLGGCLACNASGFTAGETGAMRGWVRALRFLLPDGYGVHAERGRYISENGGFILDAGERLIAWPVLTYPRPSIKNASGPFSASDGRVDIVDLMVGSEGLFGLITACTLGLIEHPGRYLDIFFSLPDETDALRLLGAVRAHFQGDLGGLTACEYFGVNCRHYMTHGDRFFHGSDAVGVYIQEPLGGRDVEEAAMRWLDILAGADLDLPDASILMLDTDALRALFMEARHSMPANALEVVKQRDTFTIMTDTVVPPERFREFLETTHRCIRSRGLDYLSFGHLGDCHLHFTILPRRDQLEQALAAYDAIVRGSAALGGVYSGEHGTGKRKRKDFLRCYGPAAAAMVRGCKQAVDPRMILNRGNVIPSDFLTRPEN